MRIRTQYLYLLVFNLGLVINVFVQPANAVPCYELTREEIGEIDQHRFERLRNFNGNGGTFLPVSDLRSSVEQLQIPQGTVSFGRYNFWEFVSFKSSPVMVGRGLHQETQVNREETDYVAVFDKPYSVQQRPGVWRPEQFATTRRGIIETESTVWVRRENPIYFLITPYSNSAGAKLGVNVALAYDREVERERGPMYWEGPNQSVEVTTEKQTISVPFFTMKMSFLEDGGRDVLWADVRPDNSRIEKNVYILRIVYDSGSRQLVQIKYRLTVNPGEQNFMIAQRPIRNSKVKVDRSLFQSNP